MEKLLSLIVLLLGFIRLYGQEDVMLSELNPATVNMDFGDYDPATALYMGQLSELAYWKADQLEGLFNRVDSLYPESNLHYQFLDNEKTHTQALLWCTKNFLVIAFRGTEPSKLRDWLSDAKFWNYENNPSQNVSLANMPPGHGGFRKSLMELITEKEIFHEIDKIVKKSSPEANLSEFPVYLTGHSLGAAISQLFIECLHYKKYNFAGAYHFAPPLAVSCSLSEYMKANFGDRVYDIVNYKDYIPRAGRNGVAHFGKFYRICDDNLLYKEETAYVRFSGREYFFALKYHKLSNHLRAIRDASNSSAAISGRSDVPFGCMGEGIRYVDPCAETP